MRKLLVFLTILATACDTPPSLECEPGLHGCEPIDGYWCYDGAPSPVGVCLDTVDADQDVESCADYANRVSDPVEQIDGQRFCLMKCETDEDCTTAATGLGHDLRCFDIDNTFVCGLHDWSDQWPE